MPPKGKKGKKSGKKKLTKAEKDRMKQEEDERRIKEEEDEKLRKEQDEKDRAEREKVEAVERKRLEAEAARLAHIRAVKESKRRKAQLEELNEIIGSNLNFIRNQDDNRRKNAKWERYMRCDGSADPTIAGEINTYINLEKEDNSNNTIDAQLPKCRHTRVLVEELEFILSDTPEGELSENDIQRYNQTICELERLVNDKLDLASHEVTLKATHLMNSETLNLQSVYQDDQVRLYIWGNLSKNPRIKSFEFPEGAIAFDIPKLLTLSDVGYRCLITRFDHLSHLSKSFLPRRKHPEVQEPEPEAVPAETEEAKPEGGEGEDGVEREQTEQPQPDDAENLDSHMNDLMTLLNNPEKADDEEGEEGENGAEKTQEEQPEVIEDDLIKTPEPQDYEDFDGDEDMVDLRAYTPLGGIVYFNLFHMPPQPRNVKAWTITQHAQPNRLNVYDYVADEVNPAAQALKAEASTDDDPATKREERPAINVQLKVPEDTFFFEDPLLARWDEAHSVWRQDGFQDTNYVEETKRLSFKTCYFGTYALLQDIHINMPFQSWEVRPRGLNHCLLTLIAAIVELEIEIKETECCLRAPLDRPEVAHLRGQWMGLQKFQDALRMTGINIFPNEDSHKYVTVQNKNAIAETRLYQQMGLTASAMAYSWSKWNGDEKREAEKIIVQAAPQLADEPLTEDDWSLFMITRKRTMKLRMSEFDDDFSEDFAEGTEFHADMYHMALQIAPEEGQKRIRESSTGFTHTVTNLLKSTRFLIYS